MRSNQPSRLRIVRAAAISFATVATAQAQDVRVVRLGIVTDGASERTAPIADAYRHELQALLEGEFAIEEVLVEGDWTPESVAAGLDRLLADPDVDVLIAGGLLASELAARRVDLPKPVIAPYVIDAELQGVPFRAGTSGVPNLVYASFPPSLERDLRVFRELVPFERVVFLQRDIDADAIRMMRRHVDEVAAQIGIAIDIVTCGFDAASTLAVLPPDAEAVYVSPLLQFSDEEMRRLAAGLIERRLPSLSAFGVTDVRFGILATNTPETDVGRIARRVAINLQRILLGEPASDIPVTFTRGEQLTINMATARAIDVLPPFALQADAVLIAEERQDVARVVSLIDVVHDALTANLDVRAFATGVDASRQSVRAARATLFPQFDLSTRELIIDADRAGPFQAERTFSGSIEATQVLYSDGASANVEIQRQRVAADEHELREVRLDVALAAANAYLNLLRAKTVERISKDNLALTRENLERARIRVQIGLANRAEVFRWESELARNRSDVIRANAARNVAELQVNRLLNRPLEDPFRTDEIDLDDPSLPTSDPRIERYISEPRVFRRFRAFNVIEALEQAPELRRLDAAVAAQERALASTRRAFYLPDVVVQAGLDRRFHEGGVGADLRAGQGTTDWRVVAQASIPLFTSGARSAERARAQLFLDQLRTQRAATAERVEQRVRTAMHLAGASKAGIGLAEKAATAARQNLDLVADAYARGVVTIIQLLDAQNAAFVADLGAANARYEFLLDLVEAERAIGEFGFLMTPEEREDYMRRAEAYLAGAAEPRPEP